MEVWFNFVQSPGLYDKSPCMALHREGHGMCYSCTLWFFPDFSVEYSWRLSNELLHSRPCKLCGLSSPAHLCRASSSLFVSCWGGTAAPLTPGSAKILLLTISIELQGNSDHEVFKIHCSQSMRPSVHCGGCHKKA